LASGVMMFIGIIAIFFEPELSGLSLGFLDKETGSILVFIAMILGLAAIFNLCLSIKCPQCKLRWFWYGIAKDFKRNIMVGHMTHCPRCRYPESFRTTDDLGQPESEWQKGI
jgi:phage FluMu protein Com